MSYRDDSDALVARNVALERQVKDLELRKPVPAPGRTVETIARGASSIAGIGAGIWLAIAHSFPFVDPLAFWGGIGFAAFSLVAPFVGLRRALRPFTIRATHTVGCADAKHPVRVIAMIHCPADADARARRDATFGKRVADAQRIAGDMIEGVLREQLGSIDGAKIRSDAAAISSSVQDHARRALAAYGLAVDQLFVSLDPG